ncbi:MAG TPA: YfhO family protein [Edaphocola sp.]|nr:YfhO family protein [Edaphocola sp.]
MANIQKSKGKKRSFLPHVLIIGIFLIISCAFCYPAFQGKVMHQGDFFNWRYMAQQTMQYHEATGQNAFWMNSAFSGFPSVMVNTYTHSNWFAGLGSILIFQDFGHPNNPAPYLFWAMVCFYILMLALRANKWLGLIGAIAFAFSSYNPIIIAAGHTTKMLDIAYLPAVLAGVLWVYRGKYWLGGIIAALFLALFFNAGHYQIIYYGAILIGIIVVAQLVLLSKNGQFKTWLKSSLILLVIAGLAGATKAINIIPSQKYNPYTIRGGNSELTGEMHSKSGGLDKDYAFQWSNGVGETLCLLVPNLYGGASGEDIGADSHYGKTLSSLGVAPQQVDQMTAQAPLYWGPQPFLSGPVYFGAIICLLTILALFVIKSPMRWWLAGAAIFFIVLSTGNNLSMVNYFLFDHFPLLNKFRTPSMALSAASVIFPLLGIWALKDVFKEKISKEELLKKLKWSFYIVGGLCVLILLCTYMTMDFKAASDAQILQMAGNNTGVGQQLVNAIHADRASAARSDAFRSLVFILLSAGVLWAFAKGKLRKEMAIAGMGLLICMDEIPVAHRYLNDNNFIEEYQYDQQFQPSAADLEIMKDKDPAYRVMNLTTSTFNDARTSYFHNSIGGYHPAKLEIYQELIENQIGKLNSSVLDMLNTRYLIVPGAQGQPMVRRNPNACGAAWFVSDIKWAADARQAMDALNAPSLQDPKNSVKNSFQPLRTAVLRDSLKHYFTGFVFGKDSAASIVVKKYSPDTLVYETNNSENGLAVFSEIYYPEGWTATIDGKKAHILRTDFALRALMIPAGKHKVEFTFTLPGFAEGETISYMGSILLTLFILTGIVVLVLKFRKEEGTEQSEK